MRTKPRNFELIELLIREAGLGSTPSISTEKDLISFKARFQSYLNQIPSYLHSVVKPGFFLHFFLGSFAPLLDTKIAKRLGIQKIYLSFDSLEDPKASYSKALKIIIVPKGEITKENLVDKLKLFIISEKKSSSEVERKFSYGDLLNVWCMLNLGWSIDFASVKDKLRVKSAIIDKSSITKKGIFVTVEDNKLSEDSNSILEFQEIEKGKWNEPEEDIAQLGSSEGDKVKQSLEEILKVIDTLHSKYNDLSYCTDTPREAAHHGFIAGVFMNFHYRYNLRVYLEESVGRGYADIVLLPRGKERSLNSIPIVIEMKAATQDDLEIKSSNIELFNKVQKAKIDIGLEQAKGYAKGLQLNTMRILTISDNILCVGLNLDSIEDEKFLMYKSPRSDREIALPTIQALLKEALDWSGQEDIKEKIIQSLERIYYTFSEGKGKSDNYLSRFLLGQLIAINEIKDIRLERFVFLYDEYPLISPIRSCTTSAERPVTTFMLIKGNQEQDKEVFIFHVREGGKGDLSSKKVPAPNDLTEQSKITEVYVSLHEGNKSNFFSIEEVNRYNSLSEYKEGKEFFQGKLKSVPYPDSLKEVFDGALDSQCIQELNRSPSKDKYGNLFKSIGEATLSFEPLIKKEAGFQAVLHGVFSYYSDLKLKDYPRRLVLTEFQTGNAKSIDMLVQSIRLDESEGYDAKRCTPVGLELKGPRTDASTSSLKEEANKQINTNYIKGSNYKVLTDGSKAALIGVVFNRQKNNKKSLIELSKDKFDFAEVGHSSEEEDEDYEMLERCKKRVKNKSRPKNDEVFKLAYCIKDIMELCNRSQDNNLSEAVKKEMVEMCSEESKSHLEKIKSELQKSVKNVVFASEVCITSVYGNEYLYAATDGFKYDESRRRVFTWVPSKRNNPPGSCAGDKQAMWKIQPYGDNFCITSVYNEYLYAAADDLKYNENRRRMFTWVPSKRNNPPGSCGNDKQGMWKVEDFGSINSRSDKQGSSNKINLDSNSLKTRRVSDKLNDTYVLASSGRLENDPLLDSYNQTGVRDVISQMTNPKNNEEREKFVLRKRLAVGLSSQSEVTVNSTSTTTRSSSWINSLFGRVKGSVGGLFWFLPLQSEKMSKQSLHKESVPISAVKPKVTTLEMGDIYLSKVDTNSTILLLDTFIRKVTGQRYVSNNTSSISEQKAQGYTLGITDGLKKVIEQAASKSGILMHRLNIDFSGMQKEITRKVMSGKFNEISGVLNSYVEKSCPSKESGKLSPKKFNKFMIEFNKGLDLIINQSMQQISNDGDGVLEVSGAKKQQMSLEPQNYLSNISVQGHLTQDKVKLIS